MLLTGNFREYPFFTLLEIFLQRRETGLLEVSSPEETGYFYIKNGKVKDGQLGKNKGAAAVKLVGRCVDGSFRFKPLEPTDYARIVWQRSFGSQSQTFDPTSAPVATVSQKFGNLRSYPAAAYRNSERALASAAQGVLGHFLLYPIAALQSLQKTAQSAVRRLRAFRATDFSPLKRARVISRPVGLAAIGNTFGRVRSSAASRLRASEHSAATALRASEHAAATALRASEHAAATALRASEHAAATALRASEHFVVSAAQGSLRQFQSVTAEASHALSTSTSKLAQGTAAWATASFDFAKRARLQSRLQRLTKNVFAAWQSAWRRDKNRIRDCARYARQFTFHISLPAASNKAAIAASLQQAKGNVIFTLIVCVLSSVSALCLYQLLRADPLPVDSGTVDQNFDTQLSPVRGDPVRSSRKPRRSKREVRDKTRDSSTEQ